MRDPYGLSFAAGLILKETPYLVLMMIAAAGQVSARPMVAAARSMGYAGPTAWIKVAFPLIYEQIRLPVYAVLAFALSVVDVALVLAPAFRRHCPSWQRGGLPDTSLRCICRAAAAATLQLTIVAGGDRRLAPRRESGDRRHRARLGCRRQSTRLGALRSCGSRAGPRRHRGLTARRLCRLPGLMVVRAGMAVAATLSRADGPG